MIGRLELIGAAAGLSVITGFGLYQLGRAHADAACAKKMQQAAEDAAKAVGEDSDRQRDVGRTVDDAVTAEIRRLRAEMQRARYAATDLDSALCGDAGDLDRLHDAYDEVFKEPVRNPFIDSDDRAD